MTLLAEILYALRFRAERIGNRLRRWYWGSLIRARDGRVGSNLLIHRGARFDLGPGCRIDFGDNVTFGEGARIFVHERATLRLGNGVYIGRNATIASSAEIQIGAGSQLAHGVTVIDTDHKFGAKELPLVAQGAESAPIVIGSNVWVGAQAVILKGKRIGDRAAIGAGAIVTQDVAQDKVAVGNPARELQ